MFRSLVVSSFAILVCQSLQAQQTSGGEVSRYPLPSTLTYPEGIALAKDRTAFYTASAENGAVVRVELASGEARTVVPAGVLVGQKPPFPALLGLELDRENVLWIAGGRTGSMHAVDARSGRSVRKFQSPRARSLINDVAVIGDSAYFTDSLNPVLWRVPAQDRIGDLEPWIDLSDTPIPHVTGANLNGIVATADGRGLIVAHMAEGRLFRVDIDSKQITPIEVQGGALTGADGLVLDRDRLYVVRQPENEIVALRLSGDRAEELTRSRNPALRWPATAEKAGDRLLVVNTQFNRRESGKASRPFEIVGIALTELAGTRR